MSIIDPRLKDRILKRRPDPRYTRIGAELERVIRAGWRQEEILREGCPVKEIELSTVRVTPDLRQAFIGFIPFPLPDVIPHTLEHQLTEWGKGAAPSVRHYVATHMKLKYTPQIHVVLDLRYVEALRSERRLDSLIREEKKEEKEIREEE